LSIGEKRYIVSGDERVDTLGQPLHYAVLPDIFSKHAIKHIVSFSLWTLDDKTGIIQYLNDRSLESLGDEFEARLSGLDGWPYANRCNKSVMNFANMTTRENIPTLTAVLLWSSSLETRLTELIRLELLGSFGTGLARDINRGEFGDLGMDIVFSDVC
jgi:hypothetical protein